MANHQAPLLVTQLTKMLAELNNAKTRTEVLLQSPTISKDSRYILKLMLGNVSNALAQFKRLVPPEKLVVLENSILGEDEALQLENVTDMFIDCPPEVRDGIEEYITGAYRECQNKN